MEGSRIRLRWDNKYGNVNTNILKQENDSAVTLPDKLLSEQPKIIITGVTYRSFLTASGVNF